MLTRQEIFDKAWTGLKSQGFEQSMMDDDSDTCAYRGEGGRKCAIGWCIPDDYAGLIPEAVGVENHGIRDAVGLASEDVQFASDLQQCHDLEFDPEGMQRALRAFASEHDLTIPGERP